MAREAQSPVLGPALRLRVRPPGAREGMSPVTLHPVTQALSSLLPLHNRLQPIMPILLGSIFMNLTFLVSEITELFEENWLNIKVSIHCTDTFKIYQWVMFKCLKFILKHVYLLFAFTCLNMYI